VRFEQAVSERTELTEEEWSAVEELRQGDGLYYIAQEAAMAPGIVRKWPLVVHPRGVPKHQGRLIRRRFCNRSVLRGDD
jgi:hypothetical protein